MASFHSGRFVAIALLAATLGASPGGPPGGPGTVPIHGSVTGTVQATLIDGTVDHFRLENSGRGVISHLGLTQATWVVPDVALNLTDRTVTVANLQWEGTLRAANGDTILGRYQFPQQTLPFSGTGAIAFDADLQILGGTGRFQGATGHAHSTGTANIFTRRFAISLVGQISTPGGSQP